MSVTKATTKATAKAAALSTGAGLLIAAILYACAVTDNSVKDYEEKTPVDAALRSAPFSKGVNFSGWFESFSAQSIPFTKYTEEDFANVKSLGADVIRLPVKMHSMTGPAPNYSLDPLLFKFLDQAVGWAEKYGLYIIIDNHSFDPVKGIDDDIDRILLPVWDQVSRRYKDRSDFIVYEILNEPHGISDRRWGEVQGMAIQTIRKNDTKHAVIAGGTDYNSIEKLSAIPRYSDTNVIYTFHFYDPYLFTHQGANWGGPPVLVSLAGLPFPAEGRRMPRIPADLKGTWIESSLNYSYAKDASAEKIYSALDKAAAFSRERDVPVFCGEFGVYLIQSPKEDRALWYRIVSAALDRRNISRTSWDYYGGFGIFNTQARGDFFSDLNTDVVRAMGFTPPVQTPPRVQGPRSQMRTGGFIIYGDYPDRDVSVSSWGQEIDLSLYETSSASGEFAIRWGNVSRYNSLSFVFDFGGDFSGYLSEDYCLEFKARTLNPSRFDVRFLNPESSSSIPWRMYYEINENILPPDGRWHTIRIPLKDMREHGAWLSSKQQWLSPQGKFSWEKIAALEFTAEYSDFSHRVFFDDIKITK
jgi:endoglucanase